MIVKTPLSYYGGKQNMAAKILNLIPEHNLYCEPFCGGAAIFWAKNPSNVEVLNDTNQEFINFYRVVQNDFVSLEKMIKISLNSRSLHRQAKVIYENPDMFNEIKRAWAVWVLATASFSSIIGGSWGYDIKRNTTSKKIMNKRESFTEEFAIRLQMAQLECTDAIRIINSRDTKDAFFYCDPPYYNADMGHYDGYTLDDFEGLLKTLEKVEGKFLLSSYPSDILAKYTRINNWNQMSFDMTVSVNAKGEGVRKKKTEVLTANYEMKAVD
jgi:DNA adenine methylase